MQINSDSRVNNVIRVARSLRWDEMSRTESPDGWLIKLSPAGQLRDPVVLPAAIVELGYALAPFQARLTAYITPNDGGPYVIYLVPSNPAIITPAA